MENNYLNENQTTKYRIMVDGNVLWEAASKEAINSFLASLLPETRAKAQIVPVTESGQQILLG